MKMVVAFVQPFMAEKVVQALRDLDRLVGATFSECQGFGRQRAQGSGSLEEELRGTVPKMRVETAVADELVELVTRTIMEAAHTGRHGDGKVYILPLEQAFRISSGESSKEAL